MKIVCPQCDFTREVPDDRLPAAAVIATCPHCQHRFRVTRDGVEPILSAPAPQPVSDLTDGDDPLPPGAIIPGRDSDPAATQSATSAPPPASPRSQTATSGQPLESDRSSVSGPRPASRQPDESASAPSRESTASPASQSSPPLSPDEEDELRKTAAAAYERQAGEEMSFAIENPWETPEKEGYPAAFYQTSVRVMFAAPRFFAGLSPDTLQRKALFYYLVVCVIQILVERFWGEVLSTTLAPGATNDPQLQKLLEMLAPQTNVLMTVLLRSALMTMELFVAAALYFLIFKLIVPTRANYQLIFQVLAYSTAPSLLCVVPVAGSVAGVIWGIACSFVGCRYAMGLSWPQTVMGLVPVYLLGIPFLLHLLQSVQGVMG